MRIDLGGITFGDEELCSLTGGWWGGYLLHACKDPCHRVAVGYDTKTKLLSSHPEYLTARRGNGMFLNAIDPPLPLFKAEMFTAALDFIDEAVASGQPVAIHCNQGKSRAPSIVLLYLAKRLKSIADDDYTTARQVFETLLPPDTYQPSKGIETFLLANWSAIR